MRGASLLEAIVAIFLLVGGSLACFALLIQAFRYQAHSQVVTDATLVAEQSLESVRNWALTPANFDSDWSIYSAVDYPSTRPPGFIARVSVTPLQGPEEVITPCYRQVTVTVFSGRRQVLALTGQVGSPLRRPALVRVEPEGATTLAPEGRVRFRAYLVDASDVSVPGYSVNWSIMPQSDPGVPMLPGSGTVERVGANVGLLTHRIYSPGPAYDPGWLKVRATCRYRDQVFTGDSALVELTP